MYIFVFYFLHIGGNLDASSAGDSRDLGFVRAGGDDAWGVDGGCWSEPDGFAW